MKTIKKILNEIKKLFSGPDGELSLRRLLGTYLIVHGGIIIAMSNGPMADNIYQVFSVGVGRGAVMVALGLILFGVITMQNIKEIAGKKEE
jgi:hypothetical protein